MIPARPGRTALGVARRRAAHQLLDRPLVLDDPLALQIIGSEEHDQLDCHLPRVHAPGSSSTTAVFALLGVAELMSVGELVAVVFMASGCVAAWRNPWDDRSWLVAGLGVFVAAGVELVYLGILPVALTGPASGSIVLASVLLGVLLWAKVLGLPRSLALLIGIGLTSRPLRFGNRLIALRERFSEAIGNAQTDPDRKVDWIEIAEAQIRRERAVRPPDAVWGSVRDELADHDAGWLALVRADAAPESYEAHIEAFGPVKARWSDMKDRAAADQRQLANPARRRRGAMVALGSLGISLILVGMAQAVDPRLVGIGDLRPWLISVPFVCAFLTFVALWVALRPSALDGGGLSVESGHD